MKERYSCIVAEDDYHVRKQLIQAALGAGLNLLDSVSSGTRLMESVVKYKPDIIITDILLDRMDGLSACSNLIKQGFPLQIIVVSNSFLPEHYSIGFELNLVDFINKPIQEARLDKALRQAKTNLNEQRLLNQLLHEKAHLINIKQRYHDIDVNEDHILFIEKTDKRLFKIYMANNSVIETSTNLEQIKEQCSPNIFIPHRSYLANIIHIQAVIPFPSIPGNHEIIYPDSHYRVPLTRRNYATYNLLKNSLL